MSRESKRAELMAFYEKRGQSAQHMLDLDDDYPNAEMFGSQSIGADSGPGWEVLLEPCMRVLHDNGCKVAQIKQKFGGLRFYWEFDENKKLTDSEKAAISSKINPIIDRSEKLSFATCEVCADSIDPPRNPGYRTVCDSCHEKSTVRGHK